MFLINSRLGHFSATHLRGFPFSRSYRVILPSSLAMIHSSTLGFSPRLPVSVYGTGCVHICLEDFLGRLLVLISSSEDSEYFRVSASGTHLTIPDLPTPFNHVFRHMAARSPLRLSIALNTSTGILTRCPSASPLGYTLGPD